MGDCRFGKHRRLLGAADYSPVFDRPDLKLSHRALLVLAKENQLPHHRLGLVIAKKNVRLAVQRNRIKRIIRESFRQLPECNPGLDIVVLARRGLADMDNQSFHAMLKEQWAGLEKKRQTLESARA